MHACVYLALFSLDTETQKGKVEDMNPWKDREGLFGMT